jgi:hypothetical protein
MDKLNTFINEDLLKTNMELIYNDLSYALTNFLKKKDLEIKKLTNSFLKDEKGLQYYYFAKDFSIDKLMLLEKDFINSKKFPKLTKIQIQKNLKIEDLDMLCWNEGEIANQLTLIDQHLFSLIQPKGFKFFFNINKNNNNNINK